MTLPPMGGLASAVVSFELMIFDSPYPPSFDPGALHPPTVPPKSSLRPEHGGSATSSPGALDGACVLKAGLDSPERKLQRTGRPSAQWRSRACRSPTS